jgi:hypothetical protein
LAQRVGLDKSDFLAAFLCGVARGVRR